MSSHLIMTITPRFQVLVQSEYGPAGANQANHSRDFTGTSTTSDNCSLRPAEPVKWPIVYPNGKEKWNFISEYKLDQALDAALGSLIKKSTESHTNAKRSLSDEACLLINRAKLITVTAKGLIGSSPTSQSLVVAASSLTAAAISLADATQYLIENLDVNDVNNTLVYNQLIEEYDTKGCEDDVLMDAKDVTVVKMKAEEIN
ncbi:hypothetical protein F5887DRAFT_1081656 [Amanita rubescens]|nr:hypothetical protein F5887DRAFT_1081656 [Amanita rubescens]